MITNKYKKVFGIGPLGGAISLVLLGFLLWLDRVMGPARILDNPMPLRLVGLVLIGIWICWHIWAIRTIWQWWAGDQLCTTGPFHFVRHPIYAGATFLLSPGIMLLLNSWTVVAWPVLMFFVFSFLVRKEEKMMFDVFGQAYEKYATRTGKLFPRLSR